MASMPEEIIQEITPERWRQALDDGNTAFEPWSWSPDGKRLTVLRHLADSFHAGVWLLTLE
ncbi:MAG TPA: hypothetical protein VJ810_18780 [Blastocatellia bacterium]|nr:hypothetical protein [Blastocatellia bacterium]